MKHMVGAPPRYVGPRRTDRPRRARLAGRSRTVATEAPRFAPPCRCDDELDAAFIDVMSDDREDER